MTYRDAAALRANYARVFTPEVRAAVAPTYQPLPSVWEGEDYELLEQLLVGRPGIGGRCFGSTLLDGGNVAVAPREHFFRQHVVEDLISLAVGLIGCGSNRSEDAALPGRQLHQQLLQLFHNQLNLAHTARNYSTN